MTAPDSPWGANPAGLVWECTGDATFPGRGQIGLSPGATGVALLPPTVPDLEATVLASVNQMATGGWIVPSIRIRQQSEDTYVAVNLELKESGIYGVAAYEIVNNEVANYAGAELGPYTAGHQYRLRIRIKGSVCQAKVWDTAEHEYDHWHITWHNGGLLAPGKVGVSAYAPGENTNSGAVVTFREFFVENPQQLLVTRSTNGIHKPQNAGTAVSLANPLVLAL